MGRQAFKGRRALILGASAGIGRALALKIAGSLRTLTIHGRDEVALRSLVRELEELGQSATAEIADFSDPLAFEGFIRRFPEVDILAVCVGPFLQAPLGGHSAGDWRRMADMNLVVPGVACSFAAPRMAERGYGRIALLGGTATEQPRACLSHAAYAAAKTGLVSLARSVAREYGGDGVACNVFCPGFTPTERQGAETAIRAATRAGSPPRLVSSDEIAEAIVNVLALSSSALNGAAIPVDKGTRPEG